MKRREFITLLGGGAAWPLAAHAQERVRRIGVLMNLAADDPEGQARLIAFVRALQQFGWTDGRNVRIDSRWATTNAVEISRHAAELAALAPDAILASSSQTRAELQQATRTVPIVFVNVVDPVGSGFVDSLARPGGNTTGFLLFEYSLSGKWLELLKQIAPNVTRAAVFRDTASPAGNAQFGAIQAVAPSLGVEVSPVNMRGASEIERAVVAFARLANGGLIVTGAPSAAAHRNLIITLAARHNLPAVYFQRNFPAAGGLISYGPDFTDQYRSATAYIDRILKGEKPADLPVPVMRPAPLSKTPAISRFSGWPRSRFPFRREKTGNCGSFRPDGTTRRWSCPARCWSCARAQGVAERFVPHGQGKR